MADYKSLFMSCLDLNGIEYSDLDSRVVRVIYSGDEVKSLKVFIIFGKDDDDSVIIFSSKFATFNEDKLASAYKVCNELNGQYRWVRFYVDKDGDIDAQIDIWAVNERTCAKVCMEQMQRFIAIMDKAYPAIMKAMWT